MINHIGSPKRNLFFTSRCPIVAFAITLPGLPRLLPCVKVHELQPRLPVDLLCHAKSLIKPKTRQVVVNVANWDTTQVFVKATGGLSQPGRSPVSNSIDSLYSNKNMMSNVENFLNRNYALFADLPLQLPPLRRLLRNSRGI